MKVTDSNYQFTTSYPIDDNNFVVAVRENSMYSDRNITPLFYRNSDGITLGIDESHVGKSVFILNTQKDMDTPTIDVRFNLHELFKISRGMLQPNDRVSNNPNFPKTKIYKNQLSEFQINEIFEIYEGEIDYATSKIRVDNSLLNELVNKKIVRTNQELFILHNNEIIGPFRLNGTENSGWFAAEKGILHNFGVYNFKDEDIIEFPYLVRARNLILDKSIIESSLIRELDFIGNKDLMTWFDAELGIQNDQFSDTDRLASLIEQIEKSTGSLGIIKTKGRYNRVKQILQNSSEFLLSKQSLLSAIPHLRTVKAESDKLQELKLKLNNELQDLQKRYDATQTQVVEKEDLAKKLEQRIEQLKIEQTVEQEKIKSDIKVEITALEEKKKLLTSEVETERLGLEKKVHGLKDEILRNEIIKKHLDDAISTLKKEFTSEQKTAMEKLSDLVKQNTHFNFISGRDFPSDSEELSNFPDFRIEGNSIRDMNTLRDQLSIVLKKKNRNYESHFIDNILISLHQNTLTLFAGLPGTGKTSLAKIITSCLTGKSRIREIPVSRGWTSQKDLIGFANPLTKKFHEAPTGFYTLLKQLDHEWSAGHYDDAPMAYVILDEANLSPLEHYWSTFYNLTDTYANFDSPLTINLGQSESFNYPNNLRFIGTINYDQTTEELSPRIVDRANIICLIPNQVNYESFSISDFEVFSLRYSDIRKMFKLNDFNSNEDLIQLNADLEERYQKVKEIFRDRLGIYISPRVELSIKKYCQVASTIMTERSRPLDYCIAQRLLPLINIQGDKKEDLSYLLSYIEGFGLSNSVSVSILQKIIDVGRKSGYTHETFNYFLTISNA